MYSSQNSKTEMLNWGSRSIREGMEIDREYWSVNREGRDPLHVEGWQMFSGSYRDNVVGREQSYVTPDRVM